MPASRLSEALLCTITSVEEWAKKERSVLLAPARWGAGAAIVFVSLALNILALLRWPLLMLRRIVRPAASARARPVSVDTQAELDALRERGKLVVVDFYAHWCGPCMLMDSALEELAERREDQLVVAKVDCSLGVPPVYGGDIPGLPTIVVFRGDQEVVRHVGALSSAHLDALIDGCLGGRPIPSQATRATPVCDPVTGVCTVTPPMTETAGRR